MELFRGNTQFYHISVLVVDRPNVNVEEIRDSIIVGLYIYHCGYIFLEKIAM